MFFFKTFSSSMLRFLSFWTVFNQKRNSLINLIVIVRIMYWNGYIQRAVASTIYVSSFICSWESCYMAANIYREKGFNSRRIFCQMFIFLRHVKNPFSDKIFPEFCTMTHFFGISLLLFHPVFYLLLCSFFGEDRDGLGVVGEGVVLCWSITVYHGLTYSLFF